jgi:transmembrane sensor
MVSQVDVERSLSWEEGQLSFDSEPLASAVERFNRYAREPLAVGDPASANVRVNGVFNAGDTEAFVEGVTALHPVRAVRSGGKITFRRK